MRRVLILLVGAVLVLGVVAGPAAAGTDDPVVFTVDSVAELCAAVAVPGAIVASTRLVKKER